MSPPERFLIVRTSALGDVVHSLPVLTALRKRFPQAAIGWVIERRLAPLLEGHPSLDQLIRVDTKGWRQGRLSWTTLRSIQSFIAELRRFRADVALDLMGNHKAGVIAALSGARRKIGLRRADRREPSSALWINEGVAASGEHAVEEPLSVLAALREPQGPPDFGADLIAAGAAAPAAVSALAARGFFLVHPGAGWHNKRYPTELWGTAAAELSAETGLACAVAWGPGERSMAEEVVAAAGEATLVEAPDLPSLIALLRRSRLVLGGDTGPVHLAHAVGTPVLALMGPTDPARHGPYGAPESSLARPLPCSYCYARLDEPKACLREIRPREVVERALELLAEAAV